MVASKLVLSLLCMGIGPDIPFHNRPLVSVSGGVGYYDLLPKTKSLDDIVSLYELVTGILLVSSGA